MRRLRWLLMVPVVASPASAQTPAGVPPVRRLERIAATSSAFSAVGQVRALSGGRLLINDMVGRRLVLTDTTFATIKVILDTTGTTDARYPRFGSFVPYRGDTTLFLDQEANAFLVLDGDGKLARTVAGPSGRGGFLSSNSRIDAAGRVIIASSGGRGTTDPASGPGARININHSILLAYDLEARRTDTAVVISIDTVRTPAGSPPPAPGSALLNRVTLFTMRDAWAVLGDGTIAVVRATDYHIDWFTAGGAKTSSARIPHEWKRLTDPDKQRFADSLTSVRDSSNKAFIAGLPPGAQPLYDATGRAVGYSPAPNLAAGAVPRPVRPTPPQVTQPVSTTLIPDYLPAIAGDAHADAENRLWIRLHETVARYPDQIFDVVDRSGKLVERVRPPSGQLVGFGPGALYLFRPDGSKGTLIRVLTR